LANIWQGERVRLRAVEPEDADCYFGWSQDTDLARADYSIDFPMLREAVRKWALEPATKEPKDDVYRWL